MNVGRRAWTGIVGSVGVLGLVGLVACGSRGEDPRPVAQDAGTFPPDLPRPTFDTASIKVGDVALTVEIADSADERAYGCMFIPELRDDRGMLFLFPSSEPRSFWMRNTRIALDIAYLSESGRIVTLRRNAQPFDERSGAYASTAPARFVLEVAGGWFERHGLNEGSMVWIPHDVLTRTPGPDDFKPNLPRRIGP